MKTSNYNIRLNPEIKNQAEKTFATFGLNLSDAINVFLHMSIKLRGFPFEIREPTLHVETLLAMNEAEQIIKDYESGLRKPNTFSNAKEMFAAIDSEDAGEESDE